YLGVEAFNDWGWRLPFIISLLLVAIAIWIRLSLGETPIFQDMKARGRTTTNPWREAFLSNNFKYVAIASVVVLGQGCVWYSGQFWALYFLLTVKKLDLLTSYYIVGIALLIATPTLILWGGLVPIVTTSMYLSTGSVGYALIYPIVVPAVMFLIAIFVMPETRKHSIWEEGAIEATRSRA